MIYNYTEIPVNPQSGDLYLDKNNYIHIWDANHRLWQIVNTTFKEIDQEDYKNKYINIPAIVDLPYNVEQKITAFEKVLEDYKAESPQRLGLELESSKSGWWIDMGNNKPYWIDIQEYKAQQEFMKMKEAAMWKYMSGGFKKLVDK